MVEMVGVDLYSVDFQSVSASDSVQRQFRGHRVESQYHPNRPINHHLHPLAVSMQAASSSVDIE